MNNKKIWMNYTRVGVRQTVSDIQRLLGENKARGVFIEYDDESVESVSFELDVHGQRLPFKLPCQWKAVVEKLYEMVSADDLSLEEIEKAKKIAWRQTFYWVQAQMGYISTGQVKPEQVFLPYLVGTNGKTFYEMIEARKFNLIGYDKKRKGEEGE